MTHRMTKMADSETYEGNPMRDGQESSAVEQARNFERAVWECDRVLVEKRNALGKMDVLVVPGDIARLSMPIRKSK